MHVWEDPELYACDDIVVCSIRGKQRKHEAEERDQERWRLVLWGMLHVAVSAHICTALVVTVLL